MLPLLALATLLPHLQQLAPNVWAAGFADKHGSANCGWVRRESDTLLIDLPRGISVPDFLAEVNKIAGKPVREVIHLTPGKEDTAIIAALKEKGVKVTPAPASRTHWLPAQRILFAGPDIVNGPRAPLKGTDTAAWVTRLEALEKFSPKSVVPGRGSWGDASLIARQKRYIQELRRQIAYGLTMGRSVASLEKDVLLPASYYTWMPYDNPAPEDVKHVYAELTAAPHFDSPRPRALVLIGDRFHEPEHLERGLRIAFQTAKVAPHFTVDVNQLNDQTLAQVDLLVILRDGMLWPDGPEKPYKIWMTPQQEQAVVQFVNSGHAFLNLHNSMGLYPENGPFLNLVGGRYIGHGPLERFRVEVVDKQHPITQGVTAWSSADEQHTPPYDKQKVHLLLENRSDEGKTAAAGWCYEPGKGRLVHLASGHTREALEHPMYQRLMVNSIHWLLRQ